MKVTFQSFTSKVFDCGLPATRGSSGKAELTFFERLEQSSGHGGGADLEKVQDMNVEVKLEYKDMESPRGRWDTACLIERFAKASVRHWLGQKGQPGRPRTTAAI